MNFLAHLLLSDDDPGVRTGNMIADFVKGKDAVARLPAAVQIGVRQHRLVDAFTDRHPMVQRSITRISRDWGWFSGIIVDVYYDHLLAREWADFATEPLRKFADRMYETVRSGTEWLDPRGRWFLDRFITDDRLARYATADGMRDTLFRLSQRIAERMPARAVRLDGAMPLLAEVDGELNADFREFFPEVRAYAAAAGAAATTT